MERVTDPSPQLDTMTKTFHLIHLTLNKPNYRTSKKKCLQYLLHLISEILILMRECCLSSSLFVLLFRITTSWIKFYELTSWLCWLLHMFLDQGHPVSVGTCSSLLQGLPIYPPPQPVDVRKWFSYQKIAISPGSVTCFLSIPSLSSVMTTTWTLLWESLPPNSWPNDLLETWSARAAPLIKATGQPSITNRMSKRLNRTNKFFRDPISPSFPTP